ncbi:MAG: Unknown protein [uncultured Sulfurovum sp.]|uniref:Uncharacterized protein n=1 Tax=uncultured Sulfurovum sp. TaxID=269237 RepID=A0A6S6SKK9_9BACT|nr:MAG: Unknown protein [uncultured Sulfurovum sp.]
MLKPLLFMLTIVTLVAISLNIDFSSETSITQEPIKISIKEEILASPEEKDVPSIPSLASLSTAKHLHDELNLLLQKAKKLFKDNKDSEALLIYEKIIEKSKNSNELKVLKIFAEACFEKAIIHYIYPNYDADSAIESYELVKDRLENSNNKELLLLYMQSRLYQAPFISKEEILITYDELIEKFTNDKEKRFDKEIEELLFTKSFILMGVDDEGAMEVLDSIIAKYENQTELPDTVKFSILNNIELSIITANDPDKYIELATEYMSDSPDTQALLQMLDIIRNAQNLDQTESLEKWFKEHANYKFPDWDFSELRKWTNNMEILETQTRINSYLDSFEKQKYNNIYQPSSTINPTIKGNEEEIY